MKGDQSDSDSEGNQANKKKARLLPKRGEYRMRAHINPLNSTPFPYPVNPNYVNWKAHYPMFFGGTQQQNHTAVCNTVEHPSNYDETYPRYDKQVEIIDVGCGFGGLLFTLSKTFPTNLIFGLEIRDKLTNYVAEKIRGMRIKQPGHYNNIAVVRTNSMRHLSQYLRRGTLLKIFICFADPHFKAKNFRRRIINTGFCSEYAYLLKPKGRLYCITDVKQLHDWHMEHLLKHTMFRQMSEEEIKDDPCIELMKTSSEESKKVDNKKGDKYYAVFERIDDQIV